MGPTAFEKKWIKQLSKFNETKIFFFHDKNKTTLKYINKRSLLGIEMYREQYYIDKWLNHFQNYLDTGVFDENAYWVKYNNHKDEEGKWHEILCTEVVGIPMKLEKKLWSVNSPEHNRYMKQERETHGDMGFKQVPRPTDAL